MSCFKIPEIMPPWEKQKMLIFDQQVTTFFTWQKKKTIFTGDSILTNKWEFGIYY